MALAATVLALLLFLPRFRSSTLPVQLIRFPPNITKLIINVGSNVDPPQPTNDESVAVLAIEPILETASQIPKTERRVVITAAISDFVGFATFHPFNTKGLSSSLSDPASQKSSLHWTRQPSTYQSFYVVPVLSMRHLLDAIPPHINILYLKTDMQGHDFVALKSAGAALQRVQRVKAETYCKGFSYYGGVRNSYEQDLLPLMRSLGFVGALPLVMLFRQSTQ